MQSLVKKKVVKKREEKTSSEKKGGMRIQARNRKGKVPDGFKIWGENGNLKRTVLQ